jgi:hypothetical protein
MISAAPTARPGTVTFVMVLTWLAAIVSIVGGVVLLLASDQALNDAGIAASRATTLGWVEIVWGVIAAMVAIGLGSGNNFSRLIVTILMVIRLGMSVLAAFTLNGLGVFWAIALAGVLALIGLSLLWNARASEFFRTN